MMMKSPIKQQDDENIEVSDELYLSPQFKMNEDRQIFNDDLI